MPQNPEAIKTTLESKALKFHIKAGNAKWQCTVMDRATHERIKAERTGSSSSIETTSSTSSSSSMRSH
ncbi:hypothetical protein N658DRAFT_505252 [Parathielavia hyrcaniae]|uniref:Uncharacterized protein n=1 Tax=Parathielavia hyrcaniae TaxID=113614 RepID=A0AAN6T4C3_9PEZI|nr:hypothetical protein N658DRAFT_505252 [Parathielavia hyrcaniae]